MWEAEMRSDDESTPWRGLLKTPRSSEAAKDECRKALRGGRYGNRLDFRIVETHSGSRVIIAISRAPHGWRMRWSSVRIQDGKA